MDVTPPSVLRRLGLALAGLAVAALTGAACALSFDDLRALAITGEARQDLAFLYPAAFDALLVVALVGVLLLRSSRLLVRVQAAIVLVLLIVAAAAVNVATAVRFVFDVRQAAVGVALAPWVMLAVALWIWLLLIKHVQARRVSDGGEDDGTAEPDIVPFHRGRNAQTPPPLVTEAPAPVMEPTPLVGPTAAPETPPVPAYDAPISAQVAEWRARESEPTEPREPADEPAPYKDAASEPTRPHRVPAHEPAQLEEPTPEPAQAGSPAPEAAHSEQPAKEPVRPREQALDEPAWGPEPAEESQEPVQDLPDLPEPVRDVEEPEHTPEPEPRPAPQPETRPVRWGDRVKPTDVLVHPRPDDRDADTQPHPVFGDEDPDPLHGPEAADTAELRKAAQDDDPEGRRQTATKATERSEDELADTVPHPAVRDDTPAPSGRLRSTPRPPED